MYLLLTGVYCNGNDLNTLQHVGAWRSLVAYLNGVQRAGGSNPLAPTNENKGLTNLKGVIPFSFVKFCEYFIAGELLFLPIKSILFVKTFLLHKSV